MSSPQPHEDNILIINCNPQLLKDLQSILNRAGYSILTAKSAEEGIQFLKSQSFALIICDHDLPKLNGLEMLKESHVLAPESMRLILVGGEEHPMLSPAIERGEITHCILKPVVLEAFLVTVKGAIAHFKAMQENRRLQKLLFDQNQNMRRNDQSQQKVLKIREEILKGKIPEDLRSFEIAAVYLTSRGEDGNFFEFYHPSANILDVAIGDVRGDGLPAALIGTTVKNRLLRFALPMSRVQVYRKGKIWNEDLFTPEEILSLINQDLETFLGGVDYFVGLIYGRFDTEAQTFTYMNRGFPLFFHYHFKKNIFTQSQGPSIPLGVLKNGPEAPISIEIGEGDLFIFPSEGLSKACSPTGELFDVSLLNEIVLTHRGSSAEHILRLIRQAVAEHTQQNNFAGDFTLVIVKIKEMVPQNLNYEGLAKFACDLSQLQAVRSFVDRICKNAPGDCEYLSTQIQLLISEVFSNLVKYAFPDRLQPLKETVIIAGSLGKEGIQFEISDKGISIDPSKMKEPALSGEDESGFGWYIIRAIADELTYIPKRTAEGWNHLHVFKKYLTQEVRMNLTHTLKDNVLIITPEFENLDTKNAGDFKNQVIDLISTYGNQKVIFDLHQLQFVDSSGLGSFLSILKVLNKQGGDLKLSRLNRSTQATLEVVSLHKIFEIFAGNEDAIRSFK
ncbi:MAG: hypothetical protein CK425_06350 [Parachlamydia sp.]|nr:MAG: hypothetical protein CK425_06350 [Parachlamydia sp.]